MSVYIVSPIKKSSKCQNLLTGWHLEFLGVPLKRSTLYKNQNTKNRRKTISRKTEFLIQILLMWQNDSNFHERGIPQARMPAIFVCGKILEPKIPMYIGGEFAKQKKRNIYVPLPPRHSSMYASYKNNSSWKYCNLFSQSTAMYNDNTILSVSRPYLSWLQKQK